MSQEQKKSLQTKQQENKIWRMRKPLKYQKKKIQMEKPARWKFLRRKWVFMYRTQYRKPTLQARYFHTLSLPQIPVMLTPRRRSHTQNGQGVRCGLQNVERITVRINKNTLSRTRARGIYYFFRILCQSYMFCHIMTLTNNLTAPGTICPFPPEGDVCKKLTQPKSTHSSAESLLLLKSLSYTPTVSDGWFFSLNGNISKLF